MTAPSLASEFCFARHDAIGTADAEDDNQFLAQCFIDTGDLSTLLDCKSPKRIIVGRTGAGKSALLRQLSTVAKNAIALSPHSLSLNFIANSGVISFFEEVGVNLSAFYILLWKHVLVVELLKRKFHIQTEESQKDAMGRLRRIFYKKDQIKEQAVDYLETWGNKFWLTTDERIKELTTRIEKSLEGKLTVGRGTTALSIEAARNLSSEEKQTIFENGQRAASDIQIRELQNLISVLSEHVFDDDQDPYYITIDLLDESWVDDRIRFKLIKALFDAIRSFKKIQQVKIIAAVRRDLLDQVLHSVREPGFQEEKYESLYLDLKWTRPQLAQLIEARVNLLIHRRYTKASVRLHDVFPTKLDGQDCIEYMVQRTFFRPRDLILFFNECIALADGQARVSVDAIKKAEGQYSYKRLQSLATEWAAHHPNLMHVAKMFDGTSERIQVAELTQELWEGKYTDLAAHVGSLDADPITRALDATFLGKVGFASTRSFVLRQLFAIGLIGLKKGPTSNAVWSFSERLPVSPGDITANSHIYIHPMFHRALSIRPINGRKQQ